MVFADEQVFFADGADAAPGEIQKVPATPSASAFGVPVPLARPLETPTSIAVDGQRVFWTTSDCEIQTTSAIR